MNPSVLSALSALSQYNVTVSGCRADGSVIVSGTWDNLMRALHNLPPNVRLNQLQNNWFSVKDSPDTHGESCFV